MTKTNGNLLQLMDAMLKQAELEKEAGNLDLASDGKTSHPSANVEDGTQPAKEGERSSENSADIAKDVPDNVEEAASKNTPGDSKKPTDSMGTQSMSSDESRAGNVDTPKSQPSMASNPAVGPNPKTKFGSDQLIGEANAIMGEIAKLLDVPQEKAAGEAATTEAPEGAEGTQSDPQLTQQDNKEAADSAELYKQAAVKYPEDEDAGYVAAEMLINYLNGGTDKQASDADAYTSVVGDITKAAEADANAYIGFMEGYQKAMQKKAQDPAALLGALGGGAGGAGPEAMMGGGGPEAMMGGAGPEAMMGEGEGAPDPAALAALAGGAPEMGAEGGEGGEMGGEELDDEAIIEALAEALDEAGITPEELAEVVAEAQGGAPAEEAEAATGEAEAGAEMAGAGEGEELAGAEGLAGMEAQAAAKSAPHVKKAAAAGSVDALKEAVSKLVRG